MRPLDGAHDKTVRPTLPNSALEKQMVTFGWRRKKIGITDDHASTLRGVPVRTTSIAAICLAVFLVWVPIPLGSNRPVFWTINAGIMFVIFVIALLGERNHVH